MRYVLLTLLTSLLAAPGCNDDSTPSSSSNSPRRNKSNTSYHDEAVDSGLAENITYTLIDEEIYDQPIKTQIVQRLVVTGVPSKANLEAEILKRYRAALARRGFRYHNPATNIGIYVYGSEQHARTGQGLWVGMLWKVYSDKEPPQVSVYDARLAALSAPNALPPSPTRFSHVRLAINSFHDYTEDRGTFRVISKDPLHIQLSPLVVPNDFPETIEELLRRSMLYGIFRTFIHTDADAITVTVVPLEINLKADTERLLPSYKQTAHVTRATALGVSRRLLGITSFDDLVETQIHGDSAITDMWSGAFNRGYYNDRSPGLDRFFFAVTR